MKKVHILPFLSAYLRAYYAILSCIFACIYFTFLVHESPSPNNMSSCTVKWVFEKIVCNANSDSHEQLKPKSQSQINK